MEKPTQITMKDIAQELGVSIATVSRALKDSPSISLDKRKAIQKYAKEHNFQPNIMAEGLRSNRTKHQKVIGIIMPEICHYYFSAVLSGIEDEASKRGYRIVVAQSRESYDREVAICEAFAKERVCGIVVSQAKETTKYDHFIKLQTNEMPLVFFDRICTGINASRAVVDDYHGAFTATTHLIDTGCKRIAFCGKPMHLEIIKNRLNGYKDALLQHGMHVEEELILHCDKRVIAEEIIPEVMMREDRPDGFFAVNDDTAVGICHTVKRLGFTVPDDVSICGFTNGERALACDPMLTTMDQRGEEVGRQAVDILINKVEGITPLNKVEKRVIRTSLIKRGTTREPHQTFPKGEEQ